MNELIQLLLYIHWQVLSAFAQAASAQNPIKGHGGNMGNDSLNYTSVFFVNRKKWEFSSVYKRSLNDMLLRDFFYDYMFSPGIQRRMLSTLWCQSLRSQKW